MEWISVYDRMPESGKLVELKDRHGTVHEGCYESKDDSFWGEIGEVLEIKMDIPSMTLGPGTMYRRIDCVLHWRTLTWDHPKSNPMRDLRELYQRAHDWWESI